MAELPASLKPIKAYIEQAKARAADPMIAYHCKLYALQEAMAMRASVPKADMGYILNLMDTLETEKAALGDLDDANVLCENYAQELFQKADDADRDGKSSLPVAKDFLAAAQIFEVCKQFGELPPDILEKIKYGKWRFVEICKATKEKRPPAPPRGLENQGPRDTGDEDATEIDDQRRRGLALPTRSRKIAISDGGQAGNCQPNTVAETHIFKLHHGR